jgi:hypothetical protein
MDNNERNRPTFVMPVMKRSRKSDFRSNGWEYQPSFQNIVSFDQNRRQWSENKQK